MNNTSPQNNIRIRESNSNDLEAILEVEKLAFDRDDEANLVAELLKDPTAKPIVSLIAVSGEKVIGHILFTRVYLEDSTHKPLMHLLAPMAVKSAYRGLALGSMLIQRGIERLKAIGSELVFVLGNEEYYPKYGFIRDAGKMGYIAPYPIPEQNANAWMVQPLAAGVLEKYSGQIRCADALNKPEHWKE